ncbi:MAG: glycosyltransferase [Solobacterium sp.]|nr:glycosyltransferase [Solobacterium sp.]
MTDKRKILFVNDEMRMGGVARVLNTLMAALPEDKYEVDLLILHKEGMLLNEIPAKVNVLEGSPFFHAVDEALNDILERKDLTALARKLRLLFYMKSGLIRGRIIKERKKLLHKQYDVEVAAKEGFCTIFTACGDSRRKINWVLTDYSVNNYSANHMPLVRRALQEIDLNIADSEQALVAYKTVFRVQNGVTIHNLMDVDTVKEKMKAPVMTELSPDVPNLIDVARFHPQKSIDRLLIASDEACRRGYPHMLYLIGGGEQEDMLRKMVQERNMKHVVFLGYQKNPYALMAACDLFVLSSLYEGFATVISESLITGTPVLTTDVSGCREQITEPDYGWVVENSQEALTAGLINALKDPQRLKEMKQSLQTYEYPNEEILQRFMEVL